MAQGFTALPVGGGGRICFRGDTRRPGEIFATGFFARDMSSDSIIYNSGNKAKLPIHTAHKKFYETAGMTVKEKRGKYYAKVSHTADIDSPTAVCLTPRFTIAPLFPFDTAVTNLWIYTVYARNLFNTHAQQVADGLNAIREELEARKEILARRKTPKGGDAQYDEFVEQTALWPLFAQELATKTVDAKDVICALQVTRAWIDTSDIFQGCTYTLDKNTLQFSRTCGVDKSVIDAVDKFIQAEPAAGTTPGRSTGFHKSEKT